MFKSLIPAFGTVIATPLQSVPVVSINILFDLATMIATITILRKICAEASRVVMLVLLNMLIAIGLACGCLISLGLYNHLVVEPGLPNHPGRPGFPIEETVLAWKGFLWLLSIPSPQASRSGIASALYGGSILFPTMFFLLLICLSVLAKAVSGSVRVCLKTFFEFLEYLGFERDPPQSLPAGLLTSMLFSLLITLALYAFC